MRVNKASMVLNEGEQSIIVLEYKLTRPDLSGFVLIDLNRA